jgi:asparagine synthase (glutamine-hydrolysing)
MSSFILYQASRAENAIQRFSEPAEPHNHKLHKVIDLVEKRIAFFGDRTGIGKTFFKAANGDFIAVLGSLQFDGDPAPACLERLLTSFDPDTFSWNGLLGTHVILIYKNGRLNVLGDGLGASKIYTNQDNSVWSNSFLAMLEFTRPKSFDTQACYEYVTNGSVFGRRTLVEGISTLPANTILSISGDEIRTHQRPSPIANEALEGPLTLDRVADYHCTRLSSVFAPIAENFGDRIRLSFSGGFDSRLMLAMLMEHGAKPTLFVYGSPNDEDVQIARLITKAEGLPLEHIDKSTVPAPDPEAFIGETEKNLFAFDGWKVETPLFDFGADREDRLKRHVDGQVPLNGSLGEIYRNFFYMPDRPSSTGAVISTFYSRYDPRAFTDKFDEKTYRAAMAESMREAIGAESDQLERSQVEELYPKFRGRFWTGRDAQINQRFGPMFFPYLEHTAISNTAKIPIGLKDLGYLQGRMIGRLNSRLANYPSDYGFALNGPRPLKYRIKTFLGTQRPPGLRKLSFRMTHRVQQARTGALSDAYLSRVIDLEFPIMRSLFNLDAVNSSTQYGLIATLEYLAQRYNLRVSDD